MWKWHHSMQCIYCHTRETRVDFRPPAMYTVPSPQPPFSLFTLLTMNGNLIFQIYKQDINHFAENISADMAKRDIAMLHRMFVNLII